MYEIHIRVSFADHTLTKHGLSVFEGDYNSTELVFHFDEDTSDKFLVFEMDNTHGETLLIQELVGNRIALTARNDKGEICSLFNEAGLYPFHIVMYGKNRSSKITSVPGWLTVNKRQVYETDEKIKAQLPIFDTLVEIVSEGNFCTAEALENAVASLNSTISFINTQLRDTKIEYKMMKYDGVNIKDGSTVVGFEDIKRYYFNPKYFMYLEYNNIICIPASNPETDTEVKFIGAFATSGTITQCSIIVKSDGTINSIQIPMENTDYKVKEFDEYEDDGTYDKYFSAHAVYNKMLTKVDKVEGKGLSSNDFTTELKDKLDGMEEGANKTTVDAELSATSENPVQNKIVKAALDKKITEPTTNGLVRKFMSGMYGTMGVDTTMPDSPINNSVPTTKLLKDYVGDKSNPLQLSDTNLQKSGLLLQSYTPAGSTPGTVGTRTYAVIERDVNTLSESGLAAFNIPTSKAVAQYVKNAVANKVDKIEGKSLSTNDYTNEERDSLDKLSKKFELVEQFTLTEDVTQIYRSQKPNGEAYNFNDVIMTLNIPIIEQGSTEAYGGTFMYIVNSETDRANNRVVAQGGVFKKGQVGNISVRAKIEGGIVFGTYGASAGNTSNKQSAFTSYSNMNMLSAENITSVLFTFFGQPIFSGTTIKIYAR